jgi:hypothetical protein
MEKIVMKQSIPGAINSGLEVKLYKIGLVYETEDMDPEVVQTFLDNGFASEYVKPVEVERHEKGLKGTPENKRVKVSENKEVADEKPKRNSRKKR